MATNTDNNITLNNIDYYFIALASSTETTNATTPTTSPESSFEGAFLDFNSFAGITLTDSLFLPFPELDFALAAPSNGIETLPDFAFKANNKNRFGFSLTRGDTHKGLPLNLKRLSKFQRSNVLNYDGIITSSSSIGSLNGPFSMFNFQCSDILKCRLDEIKISQIIPAVDTSISVGENISRILLRALDPASVDEDSFKKCTERFSDPYTYDTSWSAYTAILFLLPFCLGKTGGLDSPYYLCFDRRNYQWKLADPMDDIINLSVSERFNMGEFSGSGELNKQSNIIKDDSQNSLYMTGNDIMSYTFSEAGYDKSNQNYVNIKVTNSTNPTVIGDSSLVRISDEVNEFDQKILNTVRNKYVNGVKLNVPLDISKIGNDTAVNYKILRGPFDLQVMTRLAKTQLYNTFMFENMLLSITVPGQVYRQPGYFIEVYRSSAGGKFDKKLLGHWYITEVKHVIDSKGVYMNILTCAKPFVAN